MAGGLLGFFGGVKFNGYPDYAQSSDDLDMTLKFRLYAIDVQSFSIYISVNGEEEDFWAFNDDT